MNKKSQLIYLLVFSCFSLATVAWGTLPGSKINGKYYLSQSPWSGALAAAIADVNNLNTKVTLVIDANATLNSSLVVDSEVALEFISGYQITIPNGYSLTINGPVSAGLYQIFTDNTTGKNGVLGDAQITNVPPEWWGAVRNVTTDSSAAIIKAVNFAQTGSASGRKTVLFSDGSYYVNNPIPLASGKPITIKGSGYGSVRIIANATMTSVFQMSDNSSYERYTFTDMFINGSLKANYGIYADAGNVKGLRCERVLIMGALQAGVSISWGICNSFVNCEIINNGDAAHVANGLEFRNGGYHNGTDIAACIIANNTGFGIFVVNSYQFNVSGCVLENNSACGIGIAIGKSVNIINNYFEANGCVGFYATSPAVLIQSQIFINGTTNWNTLSYAYPADGITVSGNYYTNHGDAAPNSFVYAASLFNARIEANPKSSVDTSQELFVKREISTYRYRNVSLNGQKFYYAPDVAAGSAVQVELLSYLSVSYPATVKIIATGSGASSDMSFEVNVLIKGDQTIGGYSFSNQINTAMSTAPTIVNGSLTVNNLPAGNWTFVYSTSSTKINY